MSHRVLVLLVVTADHRGVDHGERMELLHVPGGVSPPLMARTCIGEVNPEVHPASVGLEPAVEVARECPHDPNSHVIARPGIRVGPRLGTGGQLRRIGVDVGARDRARLAVVLSGREVREHGDLVRVDSAVRRAEVVPVEVRHAWRGLLVLGLPRGVPDAMLLVRTRSGAARRRRQRRGLRRGHRGRRPEGKGREVPPRRGGVLLSRWDRCVLQNRPGVGARQDQRRGQDEHGCDDEREGDEQGRIDPRPRRCFFLDRAVVIPSCTFFAHPRRSPNSRLQRRGCAQRGLWPSAHSGGTSPAVAVHASRDAELLEPRLVERRRRAGRVRDVEDARPGCPPAPRTSPAATGCTRSSGRRGARFRGAGARASCPRGGARPGRGVPARSPRRRATRSRRPTRVQSTWT